MVIQEGACTRRLAPRWGDSSTLAGGTNGKPGHALQAVLNTSLLRGTCPATAALPGIAGRSDSRDALAPSADIIPRDLLKVEVERLLVGAPADRRIWRNWGASDKATTASKPPASTWSGPALATAATCPPPTTTWRRLPPRPGIRSERGGRADAEAVASPVNRGALIPWRVR